nr:DUF5106 domain-containing protein [Porphyromonas gulae]
MIVSIAGLFGSISSLAASCSQRPNKIHQPVDSIAPNTSAQEPELAFPLPNIPLSITSPQERASYFVKHYWDEFNFTDSAYLQKPQNMEVSVANFLGVAIALPVDEVKPSIIYPLEKSSGALLELFMRFYKKYLYEPNSPMLNEEYYIPAVDFLMKSPKISYAERIRLKERYELMLRNRVGTKAEDFIYEQSDGSLHRLSNRFTPNTILVFYEPGCHTCSQLIGQLHQDDQLHNLVEAKQLSILFIYPDNDKNTWISGLSDFPDFVEAGINSDGSITDRQLYDIKATPTLYLLGNHSNVILKDAQIQVIKDYLKGEKE